MLYNSVTIYLIYMLNINDRLNDTSADYTITMTNNAQTKKKGREGSFVL